MDVESADVKTSPKTRGGNRRPNEGQNRNAWRARILFDRDPVIETLAHERRERPQMQIECDHDDHAFERGWVVASDIGDRAPEWPTEFGPRDRHPPHQPNEE